MFCFARLDAPLFAVFGGRTVSDPPAALIPDLRRTVHSWQDVLRASRTATVREFTAWLDEWANCDCWIDRDELSVVVVLDGVGEGNDYPFQLFVLRESVARLQEQADAP